MVQIAVGAGMKNKNSASFRSTLGRVRALGSAKAGTHHWYLMRLTAVALAVLAVYPILGFFIYAVYGGYDGAIGWLKSPLAATGVILFLIAGFHHAANGLQTVIEDYIHCECAKPVLIYGIKFVAAAFAIFGIIATLKVVLGV
jgi:succinate dehydrogenase / fumarate reductase, membrane anchor subunit